jgi:glycosyltransferase involved in cell wall biosynthesis
MRILCASQDIGNCPSFRARVLPFIDLFKTNGIEIFVAKISDIKNTDGYDLLWLRRTVVPLKFMFDIPMVYDFDDAEYLPDDRAPNKKKHNGFRAIINKASIVIAGSNNLANAARKINKKNIRIIRTGVNTKDYTMSKYTNPPIIVWTGSKPTLPHLVNMSEQINYICNKHNAKLRIISDVFPDMNAEKIIWTPENQYRYLSDAAVGISPLMNTPYAQGKCAYKIIQYMASGLPVVASDVGGNRDIFGYGCKGFCIDNKNFSDALEQILNKDKINMGIENRRIVEEHFDITTLFEQLLKVMLDAKYGIT